MITTTVAELLAIQAKQLDWYCGVGNDAITPLHPVVAAELRRRIKERTAHYPRPDMEIEVAYAQIPRGGDIEHERAKIMELLEAIDPIALLDMPDEELAKRLRPPEPKPNVSVHIMAHRQMKPFMNESQWKTVRDLMDGEEGEFFRRKMIELAGVIDSMPRTYDTEKKDAPPALVYLHYFIGGCDWWITELDKGSKDDGPEDFMRQCFGYARLAPGCGELGYISIPEIVKHGAELDFHWTPKPVDQVNKDETDPDD